MSSLPRQQIEPHAPILSDQQLKLERRRTPRRPIEELATAVFRSLDQRFGLTRVLVMDSSHTGLGLRSTQAFEPGTRLTLTVNNIPMPHRSGTVTRCAPTDDGAYSVGIRFDRAQAA